MTTYPIDNPVFTYLDAINRCITSTGAEPVTNADPTQDSDVSLAQDFLHFWNFAIQGRGWRWNILEKWQSALSPDGTISLPANTLDVSHAYWASSGQPMLVTIQAGTPPLLYDVVNNTTVFTAAPQLDLILKFNFDNLPQPIKNLIAGLACKDFQAKKQTSGLLYQVDAQTERLLWAAAERGEDMQHSNNQVMGNLSTMRSLYGSGVRRNRGAF